MDTYITMYYILAQSQRSQPSMVVVRGKDFVPITTSYNKFSLELSSFIKCKPVRVSIPGRYPYPVLSQSFDAK